MSILTALNNASTALSSAQTAVAGARTTIVSQIQTVLRNPKFKFRSLQAVQKVVPGTTHADMIAAGARQSSSNAKLYTLTPRR
jgi:hypothetical protein